MASPSSTIPPLRRDPVFHAENRDSQARGKDPYGSDGSEREDDVPYQLGDSRKRRRQLASTLELERRAATIATLDCPEMLMASALSHGQTLPQERARLMQLLAGVDVEKRKRWKKRKERERERQRRAVVAAAAIQAADAAGPVQGSVAAADVAHLQAQDFATGLMAMED